MDIFSVWSTTTDLPSTQYTTKRRSWSISACDIRNTYKLNISLIGLPVIQNRIKKNKMHAYIYIYVVLIKVELKNLLTSDWYSLLASAAYLQLFQCQPYVLNTEAQLEKDPQVFSNWFPRFETNLLWEAIIMYLIEFSARYPWFLSFCFWWVSEYYFSPANFQKSRVVKNNNYVLFISMDNPARKFWFIM